MNGPRRRLEASQASLFRLFRVCLCFLTRSPESVQSARLLTSCPARLSSAAPAAESPPGRFKQPCDTLGRLRGFLFLRQRLNGLQVGSID